MSSSEIPSGPTSDLQPNVRIILLVAMRFRDAITEEIIKHELQVKIPSLPLVAQFRQSHFIYCFQTSHRPLPEGSFEVVVRDGSGRYRQEVPITILLPYDPPGDPTQTRDRYLIDLQLTPTRPLT